MCVYKNRFIFWVTSPLIGPVPRRGTFVPRLRVVVEPKSPLIILCWLVSTADLSQVCICL